MKTSRFILVILVFLASLVLMAPLTAPAEDMSETAYNESETQPLASAPRVSKAGRVPGAGAKSASDEPESLPCDETRLLLIAAPEALAKAPAVRKRIPPLGLSSLRLGTQHLDHRMDASGRISDSLTILDHSLRC